MRSRGKKELESNAQRLEQVRLHQKDASYQETWVRLPLILHLDTVTSLRPWGLIHDQG